MMNKKELIEKMAWKTDLTETQSKKVLDAFLETAKEELKNGGKVQLVGFGTFETVYKDQRMGKNPQTGMDMVIPSKNIPRFKAGKALKDTVNK